jgi:hypothetical protein
VRRDLRFVSGDGFLDLFGFLRGGFRTLGGRVFVSVSVFHLGFFTGLNRLGDSAFRWVLAMMFLFLEDFLVVGNVSWVGHRTDESRLRRAAAVSIFLGEPSG